MKDFRGGNRRSSVRTPHYTPHGWQAPRRTSRPVRRPDAFALPLANSVATNPEKVRAVEDWVTPQDLTGLQAFLGLVGYYRQYIPDFGGLQSNRGRSTASRVACWRRPYWPTQSPLWSIYLIPTTVTRMLVLYCRKYRKAGK